MRNDKSNALSLRKHGKSYRQIKAELGVPMSTLSDWFSKQDWSKEISDDLSLKVIEESKVRIEDLNKIRGENLQKLYGDARAEAVKDFEVLKNNPLFISGISIYWGEGDKASRNGFRICNTDPKMIRLFVRFLIDLCGLDIKRLKIWLLLYPDLDDLTCKKFWKKETGLSDSNFTKSITIQGRHKTNRLSYGVANISYSSRYLKEKMLVWIDLLSKIV
jgi:hypothetical protein